MPTATAALPPPTSELRTLVPASGNFKVGPHVVLRCSEKSPCTQPWSSLGGTASVALGGPSSDTQCSPTGARTPDDGSRARQLGPLEEKAALLAESTGIPASLLSQNGCCRISHACAASCSRNNELLNKKAAFSEFDEIASRMPWYMRPRQAKHTSSTETFGKVRSRSPRKTQRESHRRDGAEERRTEREARRKTNLEAMRLERERREAVESKRAEHLVKTFARKA